MWLIIIIIIITYSLTHSLTHPPTHPLTHSLTHSLTAIELSLCDSSSYTGTDKTNKNKYT
jgi:hypothetical protein